MAHLELDFSDDGDDNFEIPLNRITGGQSEGGSGATSSSNEINQDELDGFIEVEMTTSQKGAFHAVYDGFR